MEKLLEQDASSYKWVAATVGSEAAAPLELATGDAVVAIGGFNGTDPWPTLAGFEALVAKHEIHYYVGADSESFGGGRWCWCRSDSPWSRGWPGRPPTRSTR
jgi:hypothetical protein